MIYIKTSEGEIKITTSTEKKDLVKYRIKNTEKRLLILTLSGETGDEVQEIEVELSEFVNMKYLSEETKKKVREELGLKKGE